MPERILIRDLQGNQYVEGIFAIHNCQLGQTKTGKPYIKCLLSDRSGRTPGRMWNVPEDLFQGLPTDGFVHIEGQTQPYQGEIQIIIQSIYGAEPRPEDLVWLLPTSKGDPQQMFAEVVALLNSVAHPGLKSLVDAYLADQELMARFKQAPAAVALHHACLGGLLEHTLNLMKIAELLLPRYPQLNRDLVLVGFFLHDLGKCAELVWDRGFAYSDEGQLLGHTARGMLWLQEKAQALASAGSPLDPALLTVLHHIILAHHGKPEFGAAKVPATPEAIFVSLVDNLDAKMEMAIVATAGEDGQRRQDSGFGGNFTDKVWALDTRLYRPDPTQPLAPPPEKK
ncbi:MAG: HD domain-containing protein [Phycisphaeraceae bacterium]|nr:HD domain-containing protein [Phycisphaeraceae bacterium]